MRGVKLAAAIALAAAGAALIGLSTSRAQGISDGSPHAASYGIWTPSRWDTCTKTQHDAYAVIGPDGRKYPTWHPPIDPTSGCSFGHEHGRDPRGSELWKTGFIQQFFYYDANRNAVMDPSEAAVTGLPFGYAAERTNAYLAARGIASHRHEDHVGHKVEFANGEPDAATHQMNADPAGGVWVGRLANGVVDRDTGVRCFYLAKPHQGVSTADAFTNNLHEVFYFAVCKHPDPANDQRIALAQMVPFGPPGQFTKFAPLCRQSTRGDASPPVIVGTDETNRRYPSGPGTREIITRDCIEIGFLVPEGEYSGNFYEAWAATLRVVDRTGHERLSRVNLLFDVGDAARYYYPEALKALRGYRNVAAGTNRGFAIDLCYDTSLPGRRARGGACDAATRYGTVADVTWDDPRSAFRGLHRGAYFTPAVLDNVGGPEVWHTDPFGGNGQTTPFPGSIRQWLTPARLNYSDLIGGVPIDPRVVDRIHDDGGGRVHAPN
jgi:hypothetical protein